LPTNFDRYLIDAGAAVVGPIASVNAALAIIDCEANIDGAILDTNLQGEMVFPVAGRLEYQGTPYLFTTGDDASIIPSRFRHVARIEKPVIIHRLFNEISDLF